LLGYTDSALLDSVVDAFAAGDAAEVFSTVDSVIQSGQDPHRFVEDLLERIRDLIVVGSVGLAAKNVLRDIPQDQLDRMRLQVERFGKAELNYAAEVIAEGLTRMNGATSPKLQLELMLAKVLVPAQDNTETGSLARIDRLERRMGLGGNAVPTSAPASSPVASSPATGSLPTVSASAVSWESFQAAWPDIKTKLAEISRSAWQVVLPQTPVGFDGEILDIVFANENDKTVFKDGGTTSPSEQLRKAVFEVLGVRVKYRALSKPESETVAQVAKQVKSAPKEKVVEATEVVVNESRNKLIDESSQVGESVLRDILGAEPIDGGK
jgi:DNA polymerase-3 subunit gamma/tau